MSVLMSLATEWPSHTISLAETKEFLSAYVGTAQAERCQRQLDAVGVATRRSLGPLHEMVASGGIETRNARYAREAVILGVGAAQAALARSKVTARAIDRLVVSSSTGFMMPSLADHLAVRLGLRPSAERLPLTGLGCAGSLRALGAACHTNESAESRTLVVSVELCSVWLQSEEPSPEDVLSAMTFGDGAAAAVIGGGNVGGRPEILASESVLWPSSLNARGAMLTSTGFRHTSSSALPVSVVRNLRGSVGTFLERHRLSLDQLRFTLVNPRNERLLAVLAHLLSVPETFLASARHVWKTRGNTLSVGPLHLLEVLQRTTAPRDGDMGLVVVLGPGVSCELMLLRWNGEVPCGSLSA